MATLLIVDGSPMMHRIMELTFAPEGIQVIAETDGDQAIALLPVVRPDIVIADHALASRSGYDVAAFVSGHPDLGHIPVLLMASPFEPLDRARAETCGVAGEISKPFEPAQLVARVRALLAARPREQPAAAPPEARTPALKLVEPVAPSRGALDDYFDRWTRPSSGSMNRSAPARIRTVHPGRASRMCGTRSSVCRPWTSCSLTTDRRRAVRSSSITRCVAPSPSTTSPISLRPAIRPATRRTSARRPSRGPT
jgi:CheY-like chemotaxis protein